MVPPARVEWPEASRPWAPPPRQPAKALEPLEGHIRGRLEAPVQTEIQPTPAVRPPAQTLAVVPANDAPTAQPPAPPRAPTPPTPALRQVEPVETRRAEESVVERIVERIHEREIIRAAAETGSAENAISTVLEPSARATAPQHPASEARPVSPRLPPLRPAAVPATLPILKPAPTPELKHAARVPPAARKPQESPPHIEVRIGSVEVRATPQSAPAESRIAEAPMRVEEFDNYRGLRNYFQWFRG